ncbi:retrotransposon hot spot (RHS) protein, partial [Trypanosoma rangeli]
MPAKRERVYAGNRRQRPASDVPQGGERQVMLGSDGNIQQPAPQHRRVEETLQQPNWTLASSIEDVLNVRVGQINMILLNDFLRQYVDPNKAVGGDQNVAMEVFVREPDRYVTEQRLLREILNSPGYQLFEDARKLTEKGVFFLNQWKEFGQKDTVPLRTKGRLDAALQQVEEAEEAEKEIQENEKPPRLPLPEGFYESVFDATWSCVLGFPEDEDEYMVVRMEVREGKRPQELWKYMRQMNASFSVSGDEQFRPPRVELMILSSEKLW